MPVYSLDMAWRVSSWSITQNCVEVGGGATGIFVRDTKARGLDVLSFPVTAWKDFIGAVGTDSIIVK